jgi:AcrR family transcriptional regulator
MRGRRRVTSTARPPGRPRSAAADEAILRAALQLLASDGYRALTMEAVRDRAGVGKATLYRRYGSKDELARAAITHLNYDLPLPEDTGSLEGDFAVVAEAALAGVAAFDGFNLMPRLLAEVVDDPDLHRIFSAQLVEPRRRIVRELIRRAKARGEVRRDVDEDLATDLIVGPIIYRVIIAGGDPGRLGDPLEILRAALEGLRPR